ncbi:MAG TPA: hypothetical protein PK440_21355 [Candidatus Accumulibacter phosphatis]|nr:hypothetical protein [Candidatus Accumulibacter phosphatis]HRQ97505.1 hypothetical protein [Candidatus Accumulibacter phosphatis]
MPAISRRPAGAAHHHLQEASVMSAHAYLSQLQLAPVALRATTSDSLAPALRSVAVIAKTAADTAGILLADVRAAVSVGSLVSFVDGLDAQSKDDVLDSLQLAQRAANAAADRFADVRNWYQQYLDVLGQIGWVTGQFAFLEREQSEGDLRMDQAALSVLMAIATQNQLAILKEAVAALGSLASSDGTISLFAQMSAREGLGNFQMGSAQRAGNGVVELAMGAYHFRAVDSTDRIVFFKRTTRALKLWTAAQRMTLNTATYAENRAQIRQMLGEERQRAIAAIRLKPL